MRVREVGANSQGVYSQLMGRARSTTTDGFTAVFGRGRGIDEAARAKRDREAEGQRQPRAFEVVDDDGTVSFRYYLDNDSIRGVLHREDDPAIERADGHKEWWLHGQRHREDGPARASGQVSAGAPVQVTPAKKRHF